jgi:sugar/nucleoside kinase (ribokinase family)
LGNPTLDVQPDGSLLLGGTAVYAALQAARLGLRAAALGRANPAGLQPYWEPYAKEVELTLQPAGQITTFRNVSVADSRQQWLEAWAGVINTSRLPDSRILHIAPVAQEVAIDELSVECLSRMVCLTPQGLIRQWDKADGHIRLVHRTFPSAAAPLVDIVVVSEEEAPNLPELLSKVTEHGGLAVMTRGSQGCAVLTRDGWSEFRAEPARAPVDATGAGDCFAAALAVEVFEGRPLPEALRFASAAAALCVRGPGPAAIGTGAEIRSEYESWPAAPGGDDRAEPTVSSRLGRAGPPGRPPSPERG